MPTKVIIAFFTIYSPVLLFLSTNILIEMLLHGEFGETVVTKYFSMT